MRRRDYVHASILILSLLLLNACGGKGQTQTGEQAVAPPANANTSTAAPAATASNWPPPVPSGDYILSEVQHKGQISMIRPGNSTEISFRPDGTFERVSRLNGKVDHSDSGEFRIEGGNQLVLRIQISKKKIQVPPVEKKHSFTLSDDGAELRMTGSDGKVGVFRRTRELSDS